MKKLTDNTLSYTVDEDSGFWTISYKAKSGKKSVGSDLIRRIIDNDEYGCVIKVDNSKGSEAEPFSYDNASNGVGTGGTVSFNTTKINTYSVKNKKTSVIESETDKKSKSVELGHELIHILRYMGGNRKNKTDDQTGSYEYTVKNSSRKQITIPANEYQEELDTTGISYTRDSDGTFMDASNWVTTENALRNEQGLRQRGVY